MYFKISWHQDFSDLMHHLWGKYGREVFTENGIGDQLDLDKFSKNFFNNQTTTADISIDANANVCGKSVIDYAFEFPKPLQKYNSHYLLWKSLRQSYGLRIANELIEKNMNGEIYINDFSDIGKPYCFNYSTYDIALEGLTMSNRMKISRPKCLESFLRQMEQFTVYAANSTLGATGLADILIVAAYYVDRIMETGYDGRVCVEGKINPGYELTEKIKVFVSERLRSFIYTLNWEFRGNQSPFTNLSIYDEHFLSGLVPDYVFPDGQSPVISTVKVVQEIFVEAMNEELNRSHLTFPVYTAAFYVKDGVIQDDKFKEYIAEQNLPFGFLNMYYGDTSTLSSCCRLRSSTDNEYFNSFGAGSTKIGSLGVVTSNLPRLAFMATLEPEYQTERFKDLLKKSVEVVGRINNAKRNIIKRRIEHKAMPLYTLGHMDLSKQYSTYGVTGLNEALEILGIDITTPEGEDFVIELLDLINVENDKMERRFKAPHNCEQVPAESSAVKLAKRDYLMGYNREVVSAMDEGFESKPVTVQKYQLYSNQFIPLITQADMLDRLRLQGKFDSKFSGGAICHVNVGERIKDVATMMDLMDYAAKCGVVYWAVNYALKRCEEGHIFVDGDTCPKCGKPTASVVVRVVGFFTEVANWNEVRREHEFPLRQFYKESDGKFK
ncbi:MAG: ribonucleoside-triphosphate reductase [Desulfobulbaceae bacterium]|nr:ribonucleoside-triphosphate reductase [Desulfobulbaceae bacterium]